MKKNPFIIEKKRATLATKKRYKQLLKTYSKQYPEIDNQNTNFLWDSLNKRDDLLKSPNYMEQDKLKWVASKILENTSVLNIGFGSGNLEELLLSKINSYKWEGIDISPISVKSISRRFPNSKFTVKNVEDLKLKPGSIDYIVLLEVLEHLSPNKVLKVLKKLHKFLKEDGKIVLSIPLNEGLEEMVKNGINPNAHVRVYTKDLIEAELYICNFKIKESKYIYAFRNHYALKSFIVNNIPNIPKSPNGIIVVAQKI